MKGTQCMINDNKEVTIKEVAERAGVAISTVSRVLNDLDRVSDETRDKVQKAAEELGYVKNSLAASLKTGNTRMIVVIVPDIINEFYTAVVQGVEEIAATRGYYTLIFATSDSPKKEKDMFEGNFGKIIDGAVLIPSHTDMDYYRSIKKPIVVVDRCVKENTLPAVVVDNYKGAYMATEELILAGHKDIAIIIGPEEFNIGQERLLGFTHAMEHYGVELQRRYIMHSTWYQDSGYRQTMKLMEMAEPPTAIFATNNLLCLGCIEALTDLKIKIGRDISLVGFDDTLLAKELEPGISVIRRATTEMGHLAAEKLFDILENQASKSSHNKIVLDVDLIRRGSVVRLNGN